MPTPPDKPAPIQQRCEDCHVASPMTETNYTLISNKYGWRMVLHTTETGRKESIWYCPTCWPKHKPRGGSGSWGASNGG